MKILLYTFIFIIIFILYVRFLEKTSVFYPDKELTYTPDAYGLPFEDVYMQTKDHVQIHGWLVGKHHDYYLLFFHGNAGNLSGRLDKLKLFDEIGLNTLIVGYRGYGLSEGRPSESGVYLDAQAAYDYLVNDRHISPQKILVYGASLGGAVGVDLASKRPVAGLILDSTFSSARDMARHIFPIIPKFLVQIKFDSLKKIRKCHMPKLFLHSKADRTVPFKLGKKLYESAPGPKTFIEISGGHNDNVMESLGEFKSGINELIATIKESQ